MQAEERRSSSQGAPIRVAVVGATGYTGAELLRLLLGHREVRVTAVCGHSKAGRPVSEVLPSLSGLLDAEFAAFDADAIAEVAELAFCALPHGASAPTVAALRERGLRVFDLSADFRLRDPAVYAEWYGEHGAPGLFGEAVYGLVELYREALVGASLVAVPGCYPTATLLAAAPLLREGLIETDRILVDAKSGVSGAGRKAGGATHLPEAAEGIRAYKVGGAHRHTAEIEQEMGALAGSAVRICFTPHLVPMTRGILATVYAPLRAGTSVSRCVEAARALYRGSPSVAVLEAGRCPDTLWVRGSNRAHISYVIDERAGMLIAQGAIDNLLKGAAGQAIQCMNVALGLPEAEGIGGAGAWP
ncbi:MAG: N-acetyl-gamma-glutamyl-phosphate reductase [Myxococcales bacterium]|nr:N-acetyl-gamma-glutamyl-phosphate reductase [Myxococcales bacterium]